MINRETIVSNVEGNIVSDMNGEKVMLSVKNGKYYNLGEMGGEIWGYMKDPILVKTLISILTAKYNIAEVECEKQVIQFLNHLLKEGLLQVLEKKVLRVNY